MILAANIPEAAWQEIDSGRIDKCPECGGFHEGLVYAHSNHAEDAFDRDLTYHRFECPIIGIYTYVKTPYRGQQ